MHILKYHFSVTKFDGVLCFDLKKEGIQRSLFHVLSGHEIVSLKNINNYYIRNY